KIGHAGYAVRAAFSLRWRLIGGRGRLRLQETVGVVKGRPEDLAAGQVLECCGDASAHGHGRGVDRLARTEARQGSAESPEQKDRLDQVTARLLDGQRREPPVVE